MCMMPSLMRLFSVIRTRHLPVTSCRRIQGYSGVEAFQEIRYHLFQEGLTVEVIEITAVPLEPLLHIHHAPLNTHSHTTRSATNSFTGGYLRVLRSA